MRDGLSHNLAGPYLLGLGRELRKKDEAKTSQVGTTSSQGGQCEMPTKSEKNLGGVYALIIDLKPVLSM